MFKVLAGTILEIDIDLSKLEIVKILISDAKNSFSNTARAFLYFKSVITRGSFPDVSYKFWVFLMLQITSALDIYLWIL